MKTFEEVEKEFKSQHDKQFVDMAEYCYLLTVYIENNYNLIEKDNGSNNKQRN